MEPPKQMATCPLLTGLCDQLKFRQIRNLPRWARRSILTIALRARAGF